MTIRRNKTPLQLQFQRTKAVEPIPTEVITTEQQEHIKNTIYETKLDLQKLISSSSPDDDAQQEIKVRIINQTLDCLNTLESEVNYHRQICLELQKKVDVFCSSNVMVRELENSQQDLKILHKKLSLSEDFVSRAVVVGVVLSAGVTTAVLVPFMTWLVQSFTSIFLLS